jgi:hypothetical protein
VFSPLELDVDQNSPFDFLAIRRVLLALMPFLVNDFPFQILPFQFHVDNERINSIILVSPSNKHEDTSPLEMQNAEFAFELL